LAFLRPSLEEFGEWDEVSSIVRETMQRSTGATQQRQAYKRAGRWEDVDLVVRRQRQREGWGKDVCVPVKSNFGCHWIR